MDIISDRDSRFTSLLWKDFLDHIGVKSRISIVFYLQTDGQTERVNQQLEIYLRAFVSYKMANWNNLLPITEFIYNNIQTNITGITPFFTNYGYYPSSYNPQTTDTYPVNLTSKLYAYQIIGIYDQARKDLEVARKRIKDQADKRRKNPPAFVVS